MKSRNSVSIAGRPILFEYLFFECCVVGTTVSMVKRKRKMNWVIKVDVFRFDQPTCLSNQ
jgi:hypothetical protein